VHGRTLLVFGDFQAQLGEAGPVQQLLASAYVIEDECGMALKLAEIR